MELEWNRDAHFAALTHASLPSDLPKGVQLNTEQVRDGIDTAPGALFRPSCCHVETQIPQNGFRSKRTRQPADLSPLTWPSRFSVVALGQNLDTDFSMAATAVQRFNTLERIGLNGGRRFLCSRCVFPEHMA